MRTVKNLAQILLLKPFLGKIVTVAQSEIVPDRLPDRLEVTCDRLVAEKHQVPSSVLFDRRQGSVRPGAVVLTIETLITPVT